MVDRAKINICQIVISGGGVGGGINSWRYSLTFVVDDNLI